MDRSEPCGGGGLPSVVRLSGSPDHILMAANLIFRTTLLFCILLSLETNSTQKRERIESGTRGQRRLTKVVTVLSGSYRSMVPPGRDLYSLNLPEQTGVPQLPAKIVMFFQRVVNGAHSINLPSVFDEF